MHHHLLDVFFFFNFVHTVYFIERTKKCPKIVPVVPCFRMLILSDARLQRFRSTSPLTPTITMGVHLYTCVIQSDLGYNMPLVKRVLARVIQKYISTSDLWKAGAALNAWQHLLLYFPVDFKKQWRKEEQMLQYRWEKRGKKGTTTIDYGTRWRQKLFWPIRRRHWCHQIGLDPSFRKPRSSLPKNEPYSHEMQPGSEIVKF